LKDGVDDDNVVVELDDEVGTADDGRMEAPFKEND
jgi:hypothetical protein